MVVGSTSARRRVVAEDTEEILCFGGAHRAIEIHDVAYRARVHVLADVQRRVSEGERRRDRPVDDAVVGDTVAIQVNGPRRVRDDEVHPFAALDRRRELSSQPARARRALRDAEREPTLRIVSEPPDLPAFVPSVRDGLELVLRDARPERERERPAVERVSARHGRREHLRSVAIEQRLAEERRRLDRARRAAPIPRARIAVVALLPREVHDAVAAVLGLARRAATIRGDVVAVVAGLGAVVVDEVVTTELELANRIAAVAADEVPVVALLADEVDDTVAAELQLARGTASVGGNVVAIVAGFRAVVVDDVVATELELTPRRAPVAADDVPVVALLPRSIHDAVATDLQSARRATAVFGDVVAVVAGLVAVDDAVAAVLDLTPRAAPVVRGAVAVVALLGTVVDDAIPAVLDNARRIAAITRLVVAVVAEFPEVHDAVTARRERELVRRAHVVVHVDVLRVPRKVDVPGEEPRPGSAARRDIGDHDIATPGGRERSDRVADERVVGGRIRELRHDVRVR